MELKKYIGFEEHDWDQQYMPFEHIPIGGRVCWTNTSDLQTDSGCVFRGYYGTRVASVHVGIWIRWDDIKGLDVQVYRRNIKYPVLEQEKRIFA